MQKLSTPYIKRRTGESESKRKWNNCDGDSSFLKDPWMSQQSAVQSLLINSVVDQHKREKKDCVTNIPVFATQLQKYSSPIEPFYIPSSHLHPGGNLSWFLGIYISYMYIYIIYAYMSLCVWCMHSLCMWVYMSMCGCRGQKRTSSVLLYYGLGLQVFGHTSFLIWVLGFKVMSHPHTPKLSLQPLFLDLVIYLYSFLSLSLFFLHVWNVHESIILQTLTCKLFSSDQ